MLEGGLRKGNLVPLLSLILVFSLLIIPVFAQDGENGDEDIGKGVSEDEIDKAYSCLKSQLSENCGDTKSTEQTALSLLAIAYDSGKQSDCKTSLNSKKSGSCWGTTSSANCDLKSTSLAVLALDNINSAPNDAIEWILSKEKLSPDLDWFLEIDADEATSCDIQVNEGSAKTFQMNEDKKMSGSTTCLSPAESNYYLKISDSCLDDEFKISCDKDFKTTLIYKKSGSSVYYISSQTHSSSSGGTTNEQVNAYCFAKSSSCDYEGSLWASLALARTGEEISPYIPYLTSMSDENKEYLPSAFLYMLTNEDDYYSDLTNQQKQGKYWEETGKKFYDTSIALLALQNVNIEEVTNTKDYLLEIQDNSGCWNSNNIRDTAFVLYSAWPKSPVISGDGRSDCESFNHYCVSSGECLTEDTLDDFYCLHLSDVCCKTRPAEQTCAEKQGIICSSTQECSGADSIASDTNYCCLASCIEIKKNECENQGYSCKTSCSSDEVEKTGYNCDYVGDVCCDKEEGGWGIIILLIILIILVILAIIFRNQLKIWWFRIKSKLRFGKGPSESLQPPMPPMGGVPQLQRPMPRHIIPRRPTHRPRRALSRRPLKTPKTPKAPDAFEDTMDKLRKMSK